MSTVLPATSTASRSTKDDVRTFHDTGAAYVLPNDNVEHQRLELQSRLIYELMDNKVLHSPLDQSHVSKALDIGCGTGAVTHEMASLFPNAQVIGADLSPVPEVRQKLPNITYMQGNILDVGDSRFEQNSFDLVFSRLLVLAKPGGWVEMHELSTEVYNIPDNVTSLEYLRPHAITIDQLANSSHPSDASSNRLPFLWEAILNKLLALKGVDPHCAPKIPTLFEAAGLRDIHIKRYMFPWGRWEGQTREEQAIADYTVATTLEIMPVALRKAGEDAGPEYSEETEAALKDIERFQQVLSEGRNFIWICVICGRKPE
ncbi:hypothetical protein E8E13_008392 [Curvularia kusanoi]|uniref:Methyltransferase domain-containing protein n=1 Tax=Curvularia kusanoi TaxID=90978 RepID=A0A9P4TGM3_CURKU|nr:hypothetical protein E8E13_008392 [Curvularia kusanoi]